MFSGLLGNLLKGWRQPEHRVTEGAGIPEQWDVPIRKIFGVGLSLFVLLFGWFTIAQTIDPAYMGEALAYVFGALSILFSLAGLYYWGNTRSNKQTRRDEAAAKAIYAFVGMAGAVALTWAWASHARDTWWLYDLHPRVLDIVRFFGIACVASGAMGTYWFVKEIVQPWELTGFNRVLADLVDSISDYMPDLIEAELSAMGLMGEDEEESSNIEGVITGLREDIVSTVQAGINTVQSQMAHQPRSGASRVASHRIAHLKWSFDLLAFLTLGQWFGYYSRKRWVDDIEDEHDLTRLPNGLRVDHTTHPLIIQALTDNGLLQKTNKGPKLSLDDIVPEDALERLALSDCPKKLLGYYK